MSLTCHTLLLVENHLCVQQNVIVFYSYVTNNDSMLHTVIVSISRLREFCRLYGLILFRDEVNVFFASLQAESRH